jgi:hypothetical protein
MATIVIPTLGPTGLLKTGTDKVTYMLNYFFSMKAGISDLFPDLLISNHDLLTRYENTPDQYVANTKKQLMNVMARLFGENNYTVEVTYNASSKVGFYDITIEIMWIEDGQWNSLTSNVNITNNQITMSFT